MLNRWRLIAISLDYAHHASGSGYGEIARQVNFDSVITPPNGFIAKSYDRWVRATQHKKAIARLTRRRFAPEVRYLLRHAFNSPKLVHVLYGEHHCWLLRRMSPKKNVRKVATMHLPPSLWYLSFKPHQLNHFDAIILMSHSQLEPLRKELGYDGRVEVIEHGVDTERFRYFERTAPTGTIECVMVGSFLRDYHALAEVAKLALEKELDIHFHVVTSKETAEPVLGLKNVAHHSRISDSDLIALYGRCTLAIFTMRDCTANNAVLEAMATGLPIVANDIGGIRTYTTDAFACLTPDLDPQRIIESIQAAADPKEYMAKSMAARERAEALTWQHIRDKTLQLYSDVIDRGNKPSTPSQVEEK